MKWKSRLKKIRNNISKKRINKKIKIQEKKTTKRMIDGIL